MSCLPACRHPLCMPLLALHTGATWVGNTCESCKDKYCAVCAKGAPGSCLVCFSDNEYVQAVPNPSGKLYPIYRNTAGACTLCTKAPISSGCAACDATGACSQCNSTMRLDPATKTCKKAAVGCTEVYPNGSCKYCDQGESSRRGTLRSGEAGQAGHAGWPVAGMQHWVPGSPPCY